MKCSICGVELANPNSKTHINSQKHQNALKKQGGQRVLSGSTPKPSQLPVQSTPASVVDKVDNINARFMNLEKKVETIERRMDSLIPLQKKISIQDFKHQLVKEYDHLNPSSDISGVEFEVLKRRVCRELQISAEYYDDLIYDLQKEERIITVQSGREKKYIQVKKG